MKISDNGETPSGNYVGMYWYEMPITEIGDAIYINGQGHTKKDLKPIFGNFKFTQSYYQGMFLHNRIGPGFTQSTTNIKTGGDGPVWYVNSGPRTYLNINNNGQVDAVASTDKINWKLTSIWESGDYLYYNENNGSDQETLFKVNRKNMQIEATKSLGNAWRRLTFIHEDDQYFYGYNSCHIYTDYNGYFYIDKDLQTIHRWGLHRRNQYNDQPIYKNNDYIINFHWEFHYTSSRPGFLLNKMHFDDNKTNTTGFYRRSGGSNVNYSVLIHATQDGSGGYTENTSHSHVRINYPLSDGNLFTPKSGFYCHAGIGIVNDSTLRNDKNVARFYVPYIDESDASQPLAFLRGNVPIGEDAPNYYNWDVRKCNITPVAGNIDADLLKYENQGHPSGGDGSYAYREIKTTYFEDNGKSYLFVYIGDCSGVYMNDSPTMCPNFYVFRIKNHATSIKEDIHETDSIELELIQTETETYGVLGVFYPGGHTGGFKKFVWVQLAGTKNPIYEWDTASETFKTEKNKGIYGDIMEIGEDSQGRIWTIKWPQSPRRINRELHLESLNLPRRVEVVPDKNNYEYLGENIDGELKLNVYDYENNRVAVTVEIFLIGDGVEFTSNNSQTITIDSLPDNDKIIPITITGVTSIEISATITSGIS